MTALAIGSPPRTFTLPTTSRAVTAAAMAIAGIGHAAAAAAHAGSLPAVASFTGASIAQLGLAVLVLLGVRRRMAAVLVVASSVALLGLWAASRTLGVSLGHGHGGPEPVGPLDLGVVASQVVAIVATLAGIRLARGVVVGVAAGLSAALMIVAIMAPGATSASHHDGQPDHHGVHPAETTAIDPAPSPQTMEPPAAEVPAAAEPAAEPVLLPQADLAGDSHGHGAPHHHP